jgi:hypothetical protein|tara:strand:- start:32 stop:166 length:135 start_codon:yes stop_codon:yes gene_type:complete
MYEVAIIFTLLIAGGFGLSCLYDNRPSARAALEAAVHPAAAEGK